MIGRGKLICIVLLILLLLVSGVKVYTTKLRINDMPGTVQGDNPKHTPESKLPICNFTGANFIEEPCYVPPGAVYF